VPTETTTQQLLTTEFDLGTKAAVSDVESSKVRQQQWYKEPNDHVPENESHIDSHQNRWTGPYSVRTSLTMPTWGHEGEEKASEMKGEEVRQGLRGAIGRTFTNQREDIVSPDI